MADPTVALLTSGSSTQATTTVNFTTQSAGVLLILAVTSDDYATTSGAGRPESTGWTKVQDLHHNAGHALWYKISAGSESSVQYTIGSAVGSAHALVTATNIDASPLDTSNGQSTTGSQLTYATSTITPAAGRKLLIGSLSACRFSGSALSVSSWTNGYTEVADNAVTNGSTTDTIGMAYLVADGGTSQTSTGTFSATSIGAGGIIVSFKVAAAGSNFTHPYRRNPSRGLIMRGRR